MQSVLEEDMAALADERDAQARVLEAQGAEMLHE